jgi:hypothetical protein
VPPNVAVRCTRTLGVARGARRRRPTHIGQERGRFDRFAEISAARVGRAAFFTAAVVLVALWLPLIVVFRSSRHLAARPQHRHVSGRLLAYRAAAEHRASHRPRPAPQAGRAGGRPCRIDGGQEQLQKKAADVGIEGRSEMSKGELVDALRNH